MFCSKTSKLHLFDELLYSFSLVDFLPHVYAESPLKSDSPIILTNKPWLPDFPRRPNLLLNLDNEVCDSFASFDRVVEVVEKSENTKLAARKKFVFYKNRGYEILNHDVSDK